MLVLIEDTQERAKSWRTLEKPTRRTDTFPPNHEKFSSLANQIFSVYEEGRAMEQRRVHKNSTSLAHQKNHTFNEQRKKQHPKSVS